MAEKKAPFKVGDRVQFVADESDANGYNPAYMAVGTVVKVDDPVEDDMPCRVTWDDPDWKERNSCFVECGAYYRDSELAPYNPAPAQPSFEDLAGFEEAM